VEHLTIGQLARRTGIGVETIRFYERRGLIPEPPRSAAGYRQYRPDAVRRVMFIRHAKALGFSLEEVSELLALRVDPESGCADACGRARKKVSDIEQRIAELERMRDRLGRLLEACEQDGPVDGCLVLGALEDAAAP
jgi:MerR family mercuric resistance operon transcriptional regulator